MNLEFGKNLKKLRHQKDMTQDELAQKLSLSVQAISRYETGTAYPDIEMLPVIAGFFGVTVDNLLGVSSVARERRMDEYTAELRKLKDRKERLKLLRKQHAEFPDEWQIVNSMIYEMIYIPECIDEMREIVEDALKNCNDNLWRENIILSYLRAEPDEDKANSFTDKHASHYDMRKIELLDDRYYERKEYDKLKRIRQKKSFDELEHSLFRLTERINNDIEVSYKNCSYMLNFIDHFSNNSNRTKPDMWVNIKLQVMLRLANNCFILSKNDEGFTVLDEAVTLFENFFALEYDTVLTYGSPLFDKLTAKTEKECFHQITEFSGIIVTSKMMNLVYLYPNAYVNEEEKYVYDMDGFSGRMIFSDHIYKNILKYASWDGFSRVKDDPRYIALSERAKNVSSIESIDNFIFMMNSHRNRTDGYVKDMKWVCALLVKDVGAYMIFDDADDIEEKFTRMKTEGNTEVYRIACVEFGGEFIEVPEIIKKRLLELDPDNKNAEIIFDNKTDTNGPTISD